MRTLCVSRACPCAARRYVTRVTGDTALYLNDRGQPGTRDGSRDGRCTVVGGFRVLLFHFFLRILRAAAPMPISRYINVYLNTEQRHIQHANTSINQVHSRQLYKTGRRTPSPSVVCVTHVSCALHRATTRAPPASRRSGKTPNIARISCEEAVRLAIHHVRHRP